MTVAVLRSEPLMEIVSLTKRYGEQLALNDVGFAVCEGEVLGLIGPNGAGKTTLLEALAGLLPSDNGFVLVRGASIAPARRRDFMFYVPDGVRPYADQPVARVLFFVADVYGRSREFVAGIVIRVGLEGSLAKRVGSLSKGFNRRLMLALGFLARQPLLLMDEPFDGFDLKQTREMMKVLRREAAQGRTLLLSIHQLSDAERMCDRFVLLSAGEVRGVGTLDELRTRIKAPNAGLEEVFLALA
ncbi:MULTISPECIES: ABC transporter ATP-binding protein [Hyphomicrobiales]|jgi:ABC-2 type transport system ATP-binding protein|uniref:ABC transporter ATP-binding protein n=1 Tax=Hyphomicrobiales TaxID=356 RepID=UPI0002E49459|nr:ABC transporter ATP-binding protein [Afipia birgiae]